MDSIEDDARQAARHVTLMHTDAVVVAFDHMGGVFSAYRTAWGTGTATERGTARAAVEPRLPRVESAISTARSQRRTHYPSPRRARDSRGALRRRSNPTLTRLEGAPSTPVRRVAAVSICVLCEVLLVAANFQRRHLHTQVSKRHPSAAMGGSSVQG